MKFEIHPTDLAVELCKIAGCKDWFDTNQVISYLYNLKTICENKHNDDYYRTFWKILEKIVQNTAEFDFVLEEE